MSKLIHCETCGNQIAQKAKMCPHCGAKRSTGGFFKTVLIVLVVFMLFALIGAMNDPEVQANLAVAGLPECNSAQGIAAAKDELNMRILQASIQSQYVASFNLEVVDIENAREVSFNEAQKTRSCTGTAVTSQGRNNMNYSFKALNDGTTHIEAKLVQ